MSGRGRGRGRRSNAEKLAESKNTVETPGDATEPAVEVADKPKRGAKKASVLPL